MPEIFREHDLSTISSFNIPIQTCKATVAQWQRTKEQNHRYWVQVYSYGHNFTAFFVAFTNTGGSRKGSKCSKIQFKIIKKIKEIGRNTEIYGNYSGHFLQYYVAYNSSRFYVGARNIFFCRS
jgi:hypothetical protein